MPFALYIIYTSMQESAWELPASIREEAGAALYPDPTPSALVPVQDSSGSWVQMLDERSSSTYFFNTITQAMMLSYTYALIV